MNKKDIKDIDFSYFHSFIEKFYTALETGASNFARKDYKYSIKLLDDWSDFIGNRYINWEKVSDLKDFNHQLENDAVRYKDYQDENLLNKYIRVDVEGENFQHSIDLLVIPAALRQNAEFPWQSWFYVKAFSDTNPGINRSRDKMSIVSALSLESFISQSDWRLMSNEYSDDCSSYIRLSQEKCFGSISMYELLNIEPLDVVFAALTCGATLLDKKHYVPGAQTLLKGAENAGFIASFVQYSHDQVMSGFKNIHHKYDEIRQYQKDREAQINTVIGLILPVALFGWLVFIKEFSLFTFNILKTTFSYITNLF